ncbi:RDD family protein [Granulicella paludicola]|uniref:RDD family protein n=1 Tax=Granulicella paludicola TaxID=474951 RepID=UPI0021E0862D|nr:RDD family protein [Granulicella paludicola]
MSSSAQHDLYDEMFDEQAVLAATGTDRAAALRRVAAERLAAHRNRRVVNEVRVAESPQAVPAISAAAQRVRDAVAARYQQAPTFRDFMDTRPAAVPVTPVSQWVEEPVHVAQPVAAMSIAPEERPLEASVVERVAADQDARVFEAVNPQAATLSQLQVSAPDAALAEKTWDWQHSAEPFAGELEVRPYADLPQPQPLPERSYMAQAGRPEELEGLEEEIEFRLAPEFVEHHIEPLPIQANIIEFPRQLVAAKKARPRLAEGPLRTEEGDTQEQAPVLQEEQPQGFQMRIFEVEDAVMAQVAEPEIVEVAEILMEAPLAPAVPEWQGLVLDTPKPVYSQKAHAEDSDEPERLQEVPVASFELRLMSTVVDGVCIAVSFVVFVSVSLWMSGHAAEIALKGLSLPMQIMASAGLLAGLAIVYQAVFFSLGAGTLGMTYSGLEFMTLTGKKPSRDMVRRRIGANFLAAAPLGIGLLWSIIDRQKLGWNDRMSGLFLREF